MQFFPKTPMASRPVIESLGFEPRCRRFESYLASQNAVSANGRLPDSESGNVRSNRTVATMNICIKKAPQGDEGGFVVAEG